MRCIHGEMLNFSAGYSLQGHKPPHKTANRHISSAVERYGSGQKSRKRHFETKSQV